MATMIKSDILNLHSKWIIHLSSVVNYSAPSGQGEVYFQIIHYFTYIGRLQKNIQINK